MNELMIRLGECGSKGLGVFAQRRFLTGELIERAPVIVVPHEQLEFLEKTVLSYYTFGWRELGEPGDPPGDPPSDGPLHGAIAMGFGSFYNHSYEPNATFIKRFNHGVIDFVAVRDIEENEEITVNYNGAPEDRTPVWFDRHRWGWFRPDGRPDQEHGP